MNATSGSLRACALLVTAFGRSRAPLLLLTALLGAGPTACAAQSNREAPLASSLSAADSALIYAVLSAEEQRDASAPALRTGAAHPDARVRLISRRALARITDSTFAARDSLGLPDARPLPTWPLPEWAERFRALAGRSIGCDTLFRAIADPAVQVRLRAIALAGNQASCRTHREMLDALREKVIALPGGASTSSSPSGTWHEAAAALLSYSLLLPAAATEHLPRFAQHAQPEVRRAAARSAVALRDTALLMRLSADRDGNVAEAAIQGLARVAGHGVDSLFINRLSSTTPQVALAAATALKGSTLPSLSASARRALDAVNARNIASERDVRSALRALLGDSSPEPWALRQRQPLPRDVIALALGARRYIQVEHGGGERFTVELRGDVAPIMAARVLQRAREGAYDGQTWHRVEPGFVIQGGSRANNEYAGTEFFLVDELAKIAHPRGSVGMSTRGHDSGDAQWFINLRDNARLMNDYTVFAMVVEGMDAVDRVLEGAVLTRVREVSAPGLPVRP